jgi:hypothetical protein
VESELRDGKVKKKKEKGKIKRARCSTFASQPDSQSGGGGSLKELWWR